MSNLKCDGCGPSSQPEGEIETVIVIWNNKSIDFHYCQGCIKEDCRRGFQVYDSNRNLFEYIPEQLNRIPQKNEL